MPLYEYICQDCGVRFDALRSMKEADAPIFCKNCLGKNTKRALSVCYSTTAGGHSSSSGGGCGGCSGGSCSSCGHH